MALSGGKRKFLEHQWSRVPAAEMELPQSALDWLMTEPGLLDHLVEISTASERAARNDRMFFEALRDGQMRDCAECGGSFAPARTDALYCSSACRQQAYRARAAR